MSPRSRIESFLRRSEPLQTALIAVAFWTSAVVALTSLRYLEALPQVEVITARAAMACCAVLLGLVGARCVMAWRTSGSPAPILSALGGTPGLLLFGAVVSHLAISASVLGVEAIREPDTAGLLKYRVLLLGVLTTAAVGGRAVLERTERAVVAGRACRADGELRRHSRFAGPARSRHPARLTGFRFA